MVVEMSGKITMKQAINILDLAEMKQNLWRCYRDKGESVPTNPRKRKIPEERESFQPRGRSAEDGNGQQSISDFFEEKRKEKRESKNWRADRSRRGHA